MMKTLLPLKSASIGCCLLIALLFATCRSTNESSNNDQVLPTFSFDVKKNTAIQIANIFHQVVADPKARISAESLSDSSLIENTLTYSDELDRPVFHIINYKKEQGWIVVSADRRMTPVLAYAHSGKMGLAQAQGGFSLWVDGVKDLMKNARNKLTAPNELIENRWRYFESKGRSTTPNGRTSDSNCSSYDIYMHQCPSGTMYANQGYPNDLAGSFADSWSQKYSYAYSCPQVDPLNTAGACALCSNKTLTGCAPLATAMVLRANFHNKGTRKPASGYDWDLMDDGSVLCSAMGAGNIELSRLISFCYLSLNAHDESPFSCEISVTNSFIPSAFQAAGYSNQGAMVDFNANQSSVQTDLYNGYPVVMTGFKSGTSLTGHAWVADGFHLDTFYNLDCSGSSPVCQESAFLFYHLNWGEGDQSTAPNGWFGVGGFVMGTDTNNTNLQANVGVRP
ncbi:hypothetical protein G8759_06145 [Spirosoma aureum]|uniref:Spi protease inhibitor domain-containing protein n=1 Tax=Spirosoma aureum TaxID=2692134 RepID=A0A6G9AIG6_9BACT|nr:Spi family protease inhibitor [Spirosoma aureum]QIP12238.1 hypothetical protein G8759_06145 [Spirosoma aureum]